MLLLIDLANYSCILEESWKSLGISLQKFVRPLLSKPSIQAHGAAYRIYMMDLFFRPADICKQKYVDLNDLDICSPVFNFKRAIALVMEQQGRQICDVLLDQLTLPGVGNIIKNEVKIIVLFRLCS